MNELRYYVTEGGESPFAKWLSALDPIAQAKMATAIERLRLGHSSSTKAVGRGVLEYKIDFGPGHRLYFGRDGPKLIILLTGGTKKRQTGDIEAAITYWLAYKRRKEI
jgi:putative addiction module killer protein